MPTTGQRVPDERNEERMRQRVEKENGRLIIQEDRPDGKGKGWHPTAGGRPAAAAVVCCSCLLPPPAPSDGQGTKATFLTDISDMSPRQRWNCLRHVDKPAARQRQRHGERALCGRETGGVDGGGIAGGSEHCWRLLGSAPDLCDAISPLSDLVACKAPGPRHGDPLISSSDTRWDDIKLATEDDSRERRHEPTVAP
ncbi:hypothetical protein RJ55_04681 [Drechmeria coniospora]|nr:hypothetical protein RJ55_04681 [Drechmeria coniospora]